MILIIGCPGHKDGAGSLGAAAAPFSQIGGWKPNAMRFTAFGRVKSVKKFACYCICSYNRNPPIKT
jgi:hypothetical protein